MFELMLPRFLLAMPFLVCAPVLYDMSTSLDDCDTAATEAFRTISTMGRPQSHKFEQMPAICYRGKVKGHTYAAALGLTK